MRKVYGVIVSLCLMSCAMPTHPYVTVTPLAHNELEWFKDGAEMVCWAHNPTPKPITGRLECVAQDPTYASSYPVSLKPGEDKPVGFCQTMLKEIHADPCKIVEGK